MNVLEWVVVSLIVLSRVWFFLSMAPAMAASGLLGWFHGGVVLSRLTGRDQHRTLAAGLWDLGALALSVLAGCVNGWWILKISEGTAWGGGLALGAYLLARVLSAILRKKRRGS
ncbi:MAG: hypothetical protein HFF90_02300 [Oscillibacter sp.]|nr:hypothetical protein [Oscillibacter sp.]